MYIDMKTCKLLTENGPSQESLFIPHQHHNEVTLNEKVSLEEFYTSETLK